MSDPAVRGNGQDTTTELYGDIRSAGFYPQLVTDVIADAVDESPVLSHLVQVETHFDRAEIHRHITVLALTQALLIIAHVDDEQLDEGGTDVLAQVSTESIPVGHIRTVVLSYLYSQPQKYSPTDPLQEVSLAVSWSGGQRIDLGPAACGDPNCQADHGYTGQIAQEDLMLRVSAEADGPAAVVQARQFARALRRISTNAAKTR